MHAHVHLIQTLVHPTNPIRLLPHQDRFLPNDRPQLTDLLARPIPPAQQSVTMQRLQPLTVFGVRLPPRYPRQRPCVHQQYLQPAALHHFQHRYPVNASALHRHRAHLLLLQPVNTLLDLLGRGRKHQHLPIFPTPRRGANKHLTAADVNARYIRLDHGELRASIYFGDYAAFWLLHSASSERAPPAWQKFGFSSGG